MNEKTAEDYVSKNFRLRLVAKEAELAKLAKTPDIDIEVIGDQAEATKSEFRGFLSKLGESYCDVSTESKFITYEGFTVQFTARTIDATAGEKLSSGTLSFPIYSCCKHSVQLVGELVVMVEQDSKDRTKIIDWFELKPVK